MKRREFVVSSALGSMAALSGSRLPFPNRPWRPRLEWRRERF
jgi:hypothetical protein